MPTICCCWWLNTKSLVCNSGYILEGFQEQALTCAWAAEVLLSRLFVTAEDFRERPDMLPEVLENYRPICPAFIRREADLLTLTQMITNQRISAKLCLVGKPAGDYESQYWIKITQTPDTHREWLKQPSGQTCFQPVLLAARVVKSSLFIFNMQLWIINTVKPPQSFCYSTNKQLHCLRF